jgi:hypothetical protein
LYVQEIGVRFYCGASLVLSASAAAAAFCLQLP